jgi:hypothetical protein
MLGVPRTMAKRAGRTGTLGLWTDESGSYYSTYSLTTERSHVAGDVLIRFLENRSMNNGGGFYLSFPGDSRERFLCCLQFLCFSIFVAENLVLFSCTVKTVCRYRAESTEFVTLLYHLLRVIYILQRLVQLFFTLLKHNMEAGNTTHWKILSHGDIPISNRTYFVSELSLPILHICFSSNSPLLLF